MGTFDTIIFPKDEAPKCPNGHPLTSLQTKDLDCDMDTIFIVGKQMFARFAYTNDDYEGKYTLGRYHKFEVQTHVMPGSDGPYDPQNKKELILKTIDKASMVPLTAEFEAYTSCNKCQPVLMMDTSGSIFGNSFREQQPWARFILTFEDGTLINVDDSKVESRKILADRLKKQGCLVLDDNDPIAVAHRKKKTLKE